MVAVPEAVLKGEDSHDNIAKFNTKNGYIDDDWLLQIGYRDCRRRITLTPGCGYIYVLTKQVWQTKPSNPRPRVCLV